MLGEWPLEYKMIWQWRSCESFWLSACLFKRAVYLEVFWNILGVKKCVQILKGLQSGCVEDGKNWQWCDLSEEQTEDLSGVIVSRAVYNRSCVQIRELLWGDNAQGISTVTRSLHVLGDAGTGSWDGTVIQHQTERSVIRTETGKDWITDQV